MRILLIDRDAAFRQHVTGIFTSAWPGSRIEHYDPEVSGRPGPGFALAEFDLVILDNRLGAEDGLEWLRDFKARPGCPPTVMLAGQGSENVAVRAMKLGAHDYLPKPLLTKESLRHIVTQALRSRSEDHTLDMRSAAGLMEYLPGGDVCTYFTGNYVDQVRILRIFRQVLMALKDIHAAGVIHRDLKPHNVMFREDQSLAMVDFGIAKLSGLPGITLEGTLLGTPVYMSPEAIRGHAADPRSDLYSAGVMLYQMIAKSPPFTGASTVEIIEQHLDAAPPPLPRAHDEFQPLIDTLLAKDPDARPESAEATLKLIDRLFYG